MYYLPSTQNLLGIENKQSRCFALNIKENFGNNMGPLKIEKNGKSIHNRANKRICKFKIALLTRGHDPGRE